MKGIVFNLLEEVVVRDHGEELWEQILDRAGAGGAYTSLGSYDDAEFMALIEGACALLDESDEQVVRWLGRESLPLLADRYPHFFEPHTTTRPFLMTINRIIHPEVRKLYPGADVPTFDFGEDGDAMTMSYGSGRGLCWFGEGLIHGAADHYGETVAISQPRCTHRGDELCEFRIVLAAPEDTV